MAELLNKLAALLREGTLPVMVPLMLTCLGIGVLAVERALYLYDPRLVFAWWFPPVQRRVKKVREKVHSMFEEYLAAPEENRERMLDACREYRTPYSRFLQRVLYKKPHASRDVQRLRVQLALHEEERAIEGNFALLSSFAKVAPLLGLMGTVTGMIQTFAAMMTGAANDPRALSAGISVALIATNVGLVVGLPGVICMGTLSGRGKVLQEEIHHASLRLQSAQATSLKEGAQV